ncbi:uncharacterized protein [Centruroides vittatus]|uniref:uncharacterized protein n=1 Tax=Centruroides vittatus TaxID=120091 RepID=UPI00350FA79C
MNLSKGTFSNWIKSSNNTSTASFVASLETVKQGKPFMNGDFVKDCFIKMSEYHFCDFKNKTEIIAKIKDMPLSAKIVRDRTVCIADDVTSQQVTDLNSTPGFSIACNESCDVNDIAQVVLICRYVNSDGPQKELLDILPLTGQT